MSQYVVQPPPVPSLAVQGTDERFPVRRIFCVGRNYAAHAREMGHEGEDAEPFFFSKPADAAFDAGPNDGATIAYPPRTNELHHEAELAVALGRGGSDLEAEQALDHVFGYAAALDLTRRDRQREAKEAGRPWWEAKAFDRSAPVGTIGRKRDASDLDLENAAIQLFVDGAERQSARLGDMTRSVPELIAALSRSVKLEPGDLILTGTPAGVGPVERGEELRVKITGLPDCVVRVDE